MAKRPVCTDRKDRYCRDTESNVSKHDDGTAYACGYVRTECGIVGFWLWSRGEHYRLIEKKHGYSLHMEVVIDGERFTRRVETDRCTEKGIAVLARRFAREVWA